ncbi:hypothetical protein QZM46_17240 [Burkholderia vietnamiensis]|jgi:hypothetical protein|uniref:Uncharacterized protein n=1 Tax=Burkholderia vietnamiensis TaxID=60552 RepID=A0AAW7SYL0_BURVI|nr:MULTISPECIES: hypothetical protein [Burkholderia cepacia complex]MBJ9688640.1 hypothetical protein [Burkholderia vietnamiensis]MBR8005789.1 hypothetical protein [Burkholderia vietnamiensis]MBR8014509.1 hypothetical protein [Burkholderia vietnamiensis]MBR8030879.1 hypothetical protein [Burkholderia vietnamiensis]MBR8050514.1 hypothetical protein [Burkholderia vietnamiensis]
MPSFIAAGSRFGETGRAELRESVVCANRAQADRGVPVRRDPGVGGFGW